MQHGNAALTFGPPFYTGYGPWAQIPGRLLTLARLLISSSLIVQVQVFHLYEEKSVAMRSLPRHAESTRRNQLERRHDCRRASPRRGAVVDSSYVPGHLPPGEKRARHALVRISLLFPTPVGVACLPPRCPIHLPLDHQFQSSVAVDPDPDLPPDATSGEGELDATIDISRIRSRTGCVAFA